MLEDFQGLFVPALSGGQIVSNLFVAFVCGITVSYCYRWSHKGTTFSASYVRSLVTLAMITAVVMMVIGNNLARAFGLVGAMSIIRFRTALKDTQDIVFVFFALAVGLAAGVGYRMLALGSTLLVGLTLFSLSRGNFGSIHRRDYVLQFTYTVVDEGEGRPGYLDVLNRNCKRHRLINIKTRNGGEALELAFYVDLKRASDDVTLTRQLGKTDGVENVSLYADEDPDV
jgi:uncharacterized membrane protein YhiD involved in acid resistance